MKKYYALGAVLLLSCALLGSRTIDSPFAELKAEEIAWVSLFAVPPGVTVEIRDPDQIEKIAAALNQLTVAKKDPSGKNCLGQLVQYTIQKTDGSTIKVGALQPYVFLDGICYRASNETAPELLAQLGNQLLHQG